MDLTVAFCVISLALSAALLATEADQSQPAPLASGGEEGQQQRLQRRVRNNDGGGGDLTPQQQYGVGQQDGGGGIWRPTYSWSRQLASTSQQHPGLVLPQQQPSVHGLPLEWMSEEEMFANPGGVGPQPQPQQQGNQPGRGARHLAVGDANAFQSVCQSDRDLVTLNDGEFEYRPAYYHEVRCRHTAYPQLQRRNKVCSSVGFTCVQRNRTIFLTRRRFDTDCWESESRMVPSACECMWPSHALGDILRHH